MLIVLINNIQWNYSFFFFLNFYGQWTYNLSYMRNAIFIIFSQQILSDRLLLTITDEQKSNFSSMFKLELIST